jgi:hypothetical protein
VPPDVHTALISRLDASLNAGPTEGPLLATDAVAVPPKITSRMAAKMPQRNAASGLEEMQRSRQGWHLSNGYLYLDEIGQTKWQGKSTLGWTCAAVHSDHSLCELGATSGFPLLDLLTAAAAENGTARADPLLDGIEPGNKHKASNPYAEWPANPASRTGTPNSTGSGDSPTSTHEQGVHEGDKHKEERFFPGRAPRPSQMLNPEATWRVITNVIPSDLMDTLVRCYVSVPSTTCESPVRTLRPRIIVVHESSVVALSTRSQLLGRKSRRDSMNEALKFDPPPGLCQPPEMGRTRVRMFCGCSVHPLFAARRRPPGPSKSR